MSASAACTHLSTITVSELPAAVDGCEDCLREGGVWLHLRICLELVLSGSGDHGDPADHRGDPDPAVADAPLT